MEMDPFFAVTDATPPPPTESPPTSSTPTPLPSNNPPTTTNTTSSTTHAPESSSSSAIDPNDKLSLANHEISKLLQQNKITQNDVTTLQSILRENVALTGKTQKLKNLLGRSAKAQSDLKQDLSSSKHKLEHAQKAIEKLNARMEQLANQPTHMDILADFEANFDRALLSMGGVTASSSDHSYGYGEDGGETTLENVTQSGGEDPSSSLNGILLGESPTSTSSHIQDADSQDIHTLMEQLSSTQEQLQHQTQLHTQLQTHNHQLQTQIDTQTHQITSLQSKTTNLTLELRMSKNETQRIQHQLKHRSMALNEMQMEIDLVTKASVVANARASESMEVVKNIQTDQKHVEELEAKVEALQEWALASAEAKRLTVERATELESKLRQYYELYEGEEDVVGGVGGGSSNGIPPAIRGGGSGSTEGRKLWTKASSKVVGAGMDITYVVRLGECVLAPNEMVVLRWKFDLIPGDLDIDFSILKGNYEEHPKRDGADYLIKQRLVVGGAGGEVSGAFAVQNACTLLWSNKRSWIRPRAVKYSCEAYAINI